MEGFTLGIVLVIVAGIMEGLFSLGVTRTPNWKFENIWGLGSLIALVLVPWPLAVLGAGIAVVAVVGEPAGHLELDEERPPGHGFDDLEANGLAVLVSHPQVGAAGLCAAGSVDVRASDVQTGVERGRGHFNP